MPMFQYIILIKFCLTRNRYYVVALLLLLGWVVLGVPSLRSMTSPRPFTITKHYILIADGRETTQWDQIFASREDGAFVVISGLSSAAGPATTLTLPDERKQVLIDRQQRNKSTFPTRDDAVLTFYRPYAGSNCSEVVTDDHTFLGEDQHLGTKVASYGTGGFILSQNRYKDIIRLAPGLNCFAVSRDTIFVDDSGNVKSQSMETATRIQIGFADSNYFEVLPDMKEVTPSELYAARDKFLPEVRCPSCEKNTRDRLDMLYRNANQHK